MQPSSTASGQGPRCECRSIATRGKIMKGFEIGDLFKFDKMVAPTVLRVVDWIGLIGIVLACLMSITSDELREGTQFGRECMCGWWIGNQTKQKKIELKHSIRQ